jgi:hypothetical protein
VIQSSTRWRWRRIVASVHGGLLRGGKRPAKGEESVRDGAERRVVVEASPHSTFEVVEADLLL